MTACPICGTPTEPSITATDENRRCSDLRFHYGVCGSCGTIFLTNPPPDLGLYYESDYYEIPSLERLQAIGRKERNKIDIVGRFAAGKRLLEIGPAFGVFAYQARQSGFDVDTIEMDDRCCAYLRDTVGVSALQSDNPAQALAGMPSHDVVALWHVIEHLPDVKALVAAASANLVPGGILVVATPNPDAGQWALMGRHWPHLDAPRHLTLVPAETLETLGETHGLECIFLTSDDSDARHWNRFGWQWLLMNRFRSKLMKRAMLVAGYGISLLAAPFDRRPMRGAAYTMVLRKRSA